LDWHFLRVNSPLWPLTEADPPLWARDRSSLRDRLRIARDLIASIERFNRRWQGFLADLRLEGTNTQIDEYNRYYVLEKECILGSRLASRSFTPQPLLSDEFLLREYPTLPIPSIVSKPR
jgi:hypothetical protein